MAVREIDVEQFARVHDSGAKVVDVRERDEYVTGHVAGAISVPLATVPEHLDEFRGDGPTYVICQVGGRSRVAAEYLAQFGIDVVNVDGGTGGWLASGRDVVTGDTPGDRPR
jgi:rhodanese-related sulfurtransferase